MEVLRLNQLVKQYYGQLAVDKVSFGITKGKIFGLLGPNGAGKSSLLRMVTGITMPDSGSVFFNQMPFDANKHMALIGYMPEERGLYKKMKCGEQMIYLAQLKGMSKEAALQQTDYWFNRLEMQSWYHKKIENLSKGMSQKLQFVATVIHNPDLLILDEPFSGLDPVNSKIIKDEIITLANQGTTIIFSTHRMEQVEEICEEIVLMNKGKLVLEGDVKTLRQKFKKNQYKIRGEIGDVHFPYETLHRDKEEIILQLVNEEDKEKLIHFLISQKISFNLFEEIFPSLNDIFIDLVKDTAIRQFEMN